MLVRSRNTTSALKPGASWPIDFSMPSARAPPLVAASNASAARQPLARIGALHARDERRHAHRLEHVLIVGRQAPVGADAERDAAVQHVARRAKPEPSLRLLPGLCATMRRRPRAAPCRRRRSRSRARR